MKFVEFLDKHFGAIFSVLAILMVLGFAFGG